MTSEPTGRTVTSAPSGDFARRPYALADMVADGVAVLDGHHVAAAHIAGASLGGAIGHWLAVHRPERVLTLTAIMTGLLGHDTGPAWARTLAGQDLGVAR